MSAGRTVFAALALAALLACEPALGPEVNVDVSSPAFTTGGGLTTFDFTGEFTSAFDAFGVLGSPALPISFTGSYTFDPSTMDTDTDPDNGAYTSTAVGSGIEITFGGFSVATPGAGPRLSITTSDEPPGNAADIYSIRTGNIDGTGGFPSGWVFQVLIDVSKGSPSDLLTSDDLPTTPPDISISGVQTFFQIVGGPTPSDIGSLSLIGSLSSLTRVNSPPDAVAGNDQTVECTVSGGASVTLDASGSSDPDGDALTYVWIEGADTLFIGEKPNVNLNLPLGRHTIRLLVDDGNGGADTDDVVIDVVDTTTPDLTVTASPESLWPPNHKYRTISLSVSARDACDDDVVVTATVVSSEPDDANGNGDGKTTGDIRVTTAGGPVLLSSNAAPQVTFDPESDQLEVRSERAGRGQGRTYTITVTATDASGNESEKTVTVTVPHDQS